MKKNYMTLIIVATVVVCLVIPFSIAVFKRLTNSNMNITTASWSVSLNQTGISDSVYVVTGATPTTYTLKVVNESEVDVTYDVVINNIPTGVQVSIDGETYETPTNGSITFTDAGTIAYSSQGSEDTKLIYFTAPSGTTLVQNASITIDVIVSQVI